MDPGPGGATSGDELLFVHRYNPALESGLELEILGEIARVEIIAIGGSIRRLSRLQKIHGAGRWRKMKGIGRVRLPDGTIQLAEIHWYEAHGVGRKELRIKRLLGSRP